MIDSYPNTPQFPIYVISFDGKYIMQAWDETQISTNIEWHDPDGEHKDEIVFDALGRRVYLKVNLRHHEIEIFRLINTIPNDEDLKDFETWKKEFRML
jgi:hypothetical protein